jgi:galactokinase
MKEQVLKTFIDIFGSDDTAPRVFFAPGRVNLIGEHTDYNGGHVFPCAITLGTYAVVRPRADRTLSFYSMNFPDIGRVDVSLDTLLPQPEHNWVNYPKGIFATFAEQGRTAPHGLDILYYGNIPNGSGLSSSASIEVLTAFFCCQIYGWESDGIRIAKLAQYSENHFNGVNCGIMDQFAIAMGRREQALFLDTNTLVYDYVPLLLGDYRILILNTNKKRGLADSKYNERRRECEEALRRLQTRLAVSTLGDLTEETFEANTSLIGDPILEKRAHHAVYENQRTIRAKEALSTNNLDTFARLVNASGDSLREDYEVTGIELDTLVDEARKQPGVLCARMTGAGFGGCAVSLVRQDAIPAVIDAVGAAYEAKIGYPAAFYTAEAGDGPIEL